jgi:hypothetical protein
VYQFFVMCQWIINNPVLREASDSKGLLLHNDLQCACMSQLLKLSFSYNLISETFAEYMATT